jgi:hypothetical protein
MYLYMYITPIKPTYIYLLTTYHQVLSVRDPTKELQELFCRQTPGPRAYHNMVVFEER